MLQGKSFDGVARLFYQTSGGGSYVCSGSLLKGGQYVLTAAHCADDFTSMTIDFGVYGGAPKARRSAAQAVVHSGWTGALGTGTDIALVKLNQSVDDIEGFNLSSTFDLGRSFLMMGYGTTGLGSDPNTDTNWDDWGWMHWGLNTADAWDGNAAAGLFEYVADYDNGTDEFNTLSSLFGVASGKGFGNFEALIAGGDSGGGDFVWSGSEWLLSGVHSWGLDASSYYIGNCSNADLLTCNGSSWGDLSGSTAVFSHLAWIDSVTKVPEPGTLSIVALGIFAATLTSRRRRSVV